MLGVSTSAPFLRRSGSCVCGSPGPASWNGAALTLDSCHCVSETIKLAPASSPTLKVKGQQSSDPRRTCLHFPSRSSYFPTHSRVSPDCHRGYALLGRCVSSCSAGSLPSTLNYSLPGGRVISVRTGCPQNQGKRTMSKCTETGTQARALHSRRLCGAARLEFR